MQLEAAHPDPHHQSQLSLPQAPRAPQSVRQLGGLFLYSGFYHFTPQPEKVLMVQLYHEFSSKAFGASHLHNTKKNQIFYQKIKTCKLKVNEFDCVHEVLLSSESKSGTKQCYFFLGNI